MAVNRNEEKKREVFGQYKAHPTNPKGYAWDTHLPREQVNTTPNAAQSTPAPTSAETQVNAPEEAAAEVSAAAS